MEATITLEPFEFGVRSVRRFVREWLRANGVCDRTFLVVLLTSELVTNAVLHARTELSVTIRQASDRIRVEVYDGNSGMPQPCLTPAEAATGRGLALVDTLAAAWGAERYEDGKVVWFEL